MTAREVAKEDPAARSAPAERKPPPPPAPLAARYRSLFVLGRGGMGSVEAALEIEPPGSEPDLDMPDDCAYERVVALKRLLPDAARDKRRVDMFLREARLAAMLDHPNVVSAYDYGALDGELYLAMEYVEGQSLSRVLRVLSDAGKRMPPSVVAFVLAEVCRGLHAAHELTDPATGQPLQLVHRDVSPQNVMLGYDGRVRLLDFGVAKIETENVTKTGEVKGKTAYMSPEQAMGEALDRRSDLFGVGAILFECLALRRMWGDGTDMDVIRKLALENPPRLEECGADFPQGMSELHARLVAREAKGRPETASEVADALVALCSEAETASRELVEILEAHFAGQAREQRAKLTAALREVAPGQADELRESVAPVSSGGLGPASIGALTPIRVRSPGVVRATPASVATPTRGRSWTALLAASALVIAGIIAWRVASTPSPVTTTKEPITIPTPATSPTAPASTESVVLNLGLAPQPPAEVGLRPSSNLGLAPQPPAGVGLRPSSNATALTSLGTTKSAVQPPPTSANATSGVSTGNARVLARPTTTTTTSATTSARPPPTATTKPPDVDDHPF